MLYAYNARTVSTNADLHALLEDAGRMNYRNRPAENKTVPLRNVGTLDLTYTHLLPSYRFTEEAITSFGYPSTPLHRKTIFNRKYSQRKSFHKFVLGDFNATIFVKKERRVDMGVTQRYDLCGDRSCQPKAEKEDLTPCWKKERSRM
ncbi:unnamed protein product [Strongylus vulgaris]|uniref:Uncharacterized protein n=1 Tax=Strongylus vulgaris TaxID=40348 RepID=A0A3P7IH43_STRVU|nr:unnamed protein product [Strongylus vulgaris]